ncbi:MAG: DUF423 domain-containing protein [Bacteroidota bacterium]
MKNNKLGIIGFLGAIAVSFGALGAHFLKSKIESGLITADQINGFDTGVKYHMYHVLAMLIVFLFAKNNPSRYLNWAFNSFLLGIIFFSGSLYFLSTRHLLQADWLRFLGPITPIGGLFFIIGWLCISMFGFSKKI